MAAPTRKSTENNDSQIAPRRRKWGRGSGRNKSHQAPVLFRFPDVTSRDSTPFIPTAPASEAAEAADPLGAYRSDAAAAPVNLVGNATGYEPAALDQHHNTSINQVPETAAASAATEQPKRGAVAPAQTTTDGAEQPNDNPPKSRRSASSWRAPQDSWWSNVKNMAMLVLAPLVLYVAIKLLSDSNAPSGGDNSGIQVAEHEDEPRIQVFNNEAALSPSNSPSTISSELPRTADSTPATSGTAIQPPEVPHFPLSAGSVATRGHEPSSNSQAGDTFASDSRPDQVQPTRGDFRQEPVEPQPGLDDPQLLGAAHDSAMSGSFEQAPNSSTLDPASSYPDTGFPAYTFDSLARQAATARSTTNGSREELRTSSARAATTNDARLKGNILAPQIR